MQEERTDIRKKVVYAPPILRKRQRLGEVLEKPQTTLTAGGLE